MSFINLLFSVSGRINRAKWWLTALFWGLFWTVALIVLIVSYAGDFANFNSDMESEEVVRLLFRLGGGMLLFLLLIMLPMAVSAIFLGIKRLHDRNKSGWWILLFYVAPGVLEGLGSSTGSGLSFVFSIASFALSVWGIVELGFLRGTPGPNEYGPDPLSTPVVAGALVQ
jgi:uncharacterized membrane protein YhaH (DUF805 family)